MLLVAEDHHVNRLVIEHTLQDAGFEHMIVSNGKLAVEQFQSIRPDLILMDVSMPEMSGIEATRAIRRLEEDIGSRTPIIALTAHALDGDSEKCYAAGMDDYLSKPVLPDLVVEKINKWLR